jgi:hypothetical protein
MSPVGYQDREAIEALVRRARRERDIAMGRAMAEFSAAVARWCRSLLREESTRVA